MTDTTSVTVPPAGEYRLTMPRASRPIVVMVERTAAGHVLVRRGRRTVGVQAPSGYFEGSAWARVALEQLATHGQPVHRCTDCGRELTDRESIARGVGPDCWAARRSA